MTTPRQTRTTKPRKQEPRRDRIVADADSGVLPKAESPEAASGQSADPLAGRLAYSVAEAALITGLSRDLLYDQMRSGKLPYLKVGSRRLITRRNLEAFLATC